MAALFAFSLFYQGEERRGEEEFSCKFTVSRNFKNQNYFLIENYVGFKNCDKK
jgi:hypothetical protein